MKKFGWVIAIAALAVFVVYHFSVQEQNTNLKNALASQYSNELNSASEKLTELSDSIDETLIFKDKQSLDRPLEDVWRLSSDIRASISGLPIDQETSTSWLNYLTRIGNGAAQVRAGKVPIEEWQGNMVSARENLRSLADQWAFTNRNDGNKDYIVSSFVQNKVNKENEKNWKSLGASVKAYTESDFPMTASETDQQKKKDLQHISDKPVNVEEVKAKFAKLFPELADAKIYITESAKDAPYPFYHIEFHKDIRIGYADFTKKGGHLLSFLMERPFDKNTIDTESMKKNALDYLKKLGYEDTELIEFRENHIGWHLAFARKDPTNNAIVYADGLHLKIAKDNGELLGLNAMEYIQEEKLVKQKVVPLDYKTIFSDDLKIEEEKIAYVENDQLQQRLAYELLTRSDDIGTYKVYIDTETHEILQSEKLP
ncbi:MAG: PepSY1/2 domain-containing protein [Psychrobacillus sp.]